MRPTHQRRRRGRRLAGGFTFVEILVVVLIIAVLATLIVPRFFGRIGTAKRGVARQKLVEIEKAIEMFSYDYERFPRTLQELVERPADIPEDTWNTPTLKAKDLKDPWGREFVYRRPGEHGTFDLLSYGKDGQPGGEKEDADVVNWE